MDVFTRINAPLLFSLHTFKKGFTPVSYTHLLASLGAPINPAQIGVSSELVEDAVILAKEVRDRFTLLQVLWDTGLLDEYAKMIAAYFGEKANC